jgi:hypothetical protein
MHLKPTLLFVAAACATVASAIAADTDHVKLTQLDDRIRVEVDGKLFTEYYFKDVPRPYCYPIIGPEGVRMNREWPMKSIEGEEHDHPHHRSLWYAHGEINGHDFWAEGAKSGKTLHDKFVKVESGKVGTIQSRNKWVTVDGKTICTDERTLRFAGKGDERQIDYDVTIMASEGEVTMGDTKEGSMSIRLNESMRLIQPKKKKGEGHIVNSEGVRDDETWGKRAKWVDYYGPIDGKTVGVAMFDHPQNPKHPTWWHVRDYGLFAANPFGVHDFEKKPKGTGDLVIPAGKSVTFRYRFVFHKGDEKQGRVAEMYDKYSAETSSSK